MGIGAGYIQYTRPNQQQPVQQAAPVQPQANTMPSWQRQVPTAQNFRAPQLYMPGAMQQQQQANPLMGQQTTAQQYSGGYGPNLQFLANRPWMSLLQSFFRY